MVSSWGLFQMGDNHANMWIFYASILSIIDEFPATTGVISFTNVMFEEDSTFTNLMEYKKQLTKNRLIHIP